MIRIAHRGNTCGRNPHLENSPSYIKKALNKGFFAEVDVWYNKEKTKYSLGHDGPQYDINKEFLLHEQLICHAKTVMTLSQMLQDKIHCFFHQSDECALTSRGLVWKYPEVYKDNKLWGICSDWISN